MNQLRASAGAKLMVDPDLQLLQHVYLQHRSELCAYLVKKLELSKSESEDVVHGAFEKAMQMTTEQLQAIRNMRAFFYKAAYNAGVDYQRHTSVGKRYTDSLKVDSQLSRDEVDPFRKLAAAQEIEVLVKTLRRMPEKRRRLIVMNRFDGLSYAEIARRVNLSETVVRKHVARALAECIRAVKLGNGEITQ